jgi:hypothetical protein
MVFSVHHVNFCIMRTDMVVKALAGTKPNKHPDFRLFVAHRARSAVAIAESTPLQAAVSRRDVPSEAPCLVVPPDRRERHVATAQRSDRRPNLTLR